MQSEMIDWWTAGTATFVTLLVYVAFFWKLNRVKHFENHTNIRRARYTDMSNQRPDKLPPVYPNGWFGLLESGQLKRGEVKHVAALGQNFAVFRTEKGEAKILHAYCPHVGADMARGGKVRGDCLECPFHGWLFRGEDGRCTSIPYAKEVPELAHTKAWKCCEINQIIFVWFHAESAEPYWQVEPVEKVVDGTWWNHCRNEYLVNCHIRDVPENLADMAHFGTVHGPGIYFNDSNFLRHVWTNTTWAPKMSRTLSKDEPIGKPETSLDDDDSLVKSHQTEGTLNHSLQIFGRYSMLQLRVTAKQIGPGYVEIWVDTSFGRMCILQTVTPLGPFLQRVTHNIFASPLLGPYVKLVFLGECIMFERDIAVWNYKKCLKRPVLVREDRTISAFRRWYEQFFTINSPTYESSMGLDW